MSFENDLEKVRRKFEEIMGEPVELVIHAPGDKCPDCSEGETDG